MSQLMLGVAALFGFVLPIQAQAKDDTLSAGALARLGKVRYRNVGRVFSIAFAPDGKTLLAGAWDGSIRLWDVAAGKELRQYVGHRGWVRSVAFSPDGKTFASGGKDKIIRVWETATGKELRRLEGHRNWIQYLAFSPDGKLLASLAQTLYLWDVATGREVRRINRQGGVASLAFSPDGKLLAYGGVNSMALFDLAAGKEMRQFTVPPRSWYAGMAFAPDGKTLCGINGNGDHTIYLWDTATGKQLRPLGKGEWHWGNIAFAPNGRSMASASGDHSIRVWEIITRQERLQFRSPDNKPSALAFSPNSRILAQGSDDITILLWDLSGRFDKGRLRPASLSAKDLEVLWADLAHADGSAAWRAIGTLAADSKDSLPFIRKHLLAVAPVDARAIAQFVTDLDSDQFATREKAAEQLEKLGELAEPALRDALRDKPPLERRQRIDRLLEKLAAQRDNPSPERLRMLRALEALEYMDTPAARRALEELAKGAPAADLTNETNAALKRLAKRS